MRNNFSPWILVAVLLAIVATVAALAAAGIVRVPGMTDERLPHLVYLSIFVGLMAATFVTMLRRNVGETLRNAVLVGLLFLLVIAGYAYREDARAIWNSIQAELFLGAPVVRGDGTVEIRREPDNHFHVDADVNGRPVSFLIDTGASGISLSWEAARAIGIDPETLDFNIPTQTAAGPSRAAAIRISTLAVGPIVRTDLPATVLPRGVPVSLLGLGFLDTLSGYEIRRDVLTLRD
jgi:aspartyl protease family protein